MIAASNNQSSSSTANSSTDAQARTTSLAKSHDDVDVKYFFQRPDQMQQDASNVIGINNNGRHLSKWSGDDSLLLEQVH